MELHVVDTFLSHTSYCVTAQQGDRTVRRRSKSATYTSIDMDTIEVAKLPRSTSLPELYGVNAVTDICNVNVDADDAQHCLLHTLKHSVHVDYIDAGVKRNHHYMAQRISQYRKAFSDNCIGADESAIDGLMKDKQKSSPNNKIWKDLNANVLNCLLVPDFHGKKSSSSETLDLPFRDEREQVKTSTLVTPATKSSKVKILSIKRLVDS